MPAAKRLKREVLALHYAIQVRWRMLQPNLACHGVVWLQRNREGRECSSRCGGEQRIEARPLPQPWSTHAGPERWLAAPPRGPAGAGM